MPAVLAVVLAIGSPDTIDAGMSLRCSSTSDVRKNG